MNGKSTQLIEQIHQNQHNWKIVEVISDTNDFLRYIKSTSTLYRKLTNSKCSIGGITNRDYFKKINGGGYFFKQNKDKTQIIFCFEGENIGNIQLLVRIRKLLPNSTVSICDTDILNRIENFQFQPVGSYYFTLN